MKPQSLNHYRDGRRSFPGARQWFDLIFTALIRSGIFDTHCGRGIAIVSVVAALSALRCSGSPLVCPCQAIFVTSEANRSPISGATLRVLGPMAESQRPWFEFEPGRYALSDLFCRPQLIEYEVSSPGFRTQRLTHTPPFEVQGASSGQCAQPRPPVIEITLESL